MYNFVDTWRTGGGIGILKCAARFLFYWFRDATGMTEGAWRQFQRLWARPAIIKSRVAKP